VKSKRKKVVIVVQDEAGADAARFVVSEAWPIKYDPTDLNAKGNETLIELLELVNEGIERVK
jgi:phage tail-like protein